jgi:hypothetical protein
MLTGGAVKSSEWMIERYLSFFREKTVSLYFIQKEAAAP